MSRFILAPIFLTAAMHSIGAEPPKPVCAAEMVTDLKTGNILHAHNIDDPVRPASTVKILTALAVMDQRISMTDPISVSRSTEGVTIHAEYCPGDSYKSKKINTSVQGALQASLGTSHLFATTALGQHLGNAKEAFGNLLRKLGTSSKTTISEPAGTSNIKRCAGGTDENWTTARDAMTWVQELRKYPELTQLLLQKNGVLGDDHYKSTNTFLVTPKNKKTGQPLDKEFPSSDGDMALKTGYTALAQYSGIGISAWPMGNLARGKPTTTELGIVIYGCKDAQVRHNQVYRLTEYFKTPPLATAAKNPDSSNGNTYPAFGTNGTATAAATTFAP